MAAVGLPLLAVPQIGLIGLSLVKPLFLDRYVLFSMLGLALLIGAALGGAVRVTRPRFPRAAPWLVPLVVAVAVVALLPQSLAKRSPASRVDDVLAVAADVRRLKKDGDAVVFIPAARRDTALVSPDEFAGLQDIALAERPGGVRDVEGRGGESGAHTDRDAGAAAILLVTECPRWRGRCPRRGTRRRPPC